MPAYPFQSCRANCSKNNSIVKNKHVSINKNSFQKYKTSLDNERTFFVLDRTVTVNGCQFQSLVMMKIFLFKYTKL